ncbi:hypothetical protein [Pseudoalteromonas luteoviolacea]|uniref:Uncharacterized protein n=1 Tax=Pseudoalteromonas luteoviolacea S4054 TaxID=1129367 RepID=A0A0F6ABQ9_9GAMM|nr:hypothetical protein [Pseudoalteromonas luteoviolacea]AOT09053.1 hypothetical protein S4054249_14850 [Pseudoalteromonas luteoviolacea]AOT13965.1 hypothetical protein S40542_14820 [Pseudoalteromonas luteoviolacea]AOT18880.1 hypothetical protein S4054_14825 [Pseudoalteromonas luteoviolacea]KKE83281.1 hypothetical protein N479_14890 [Pseudoalteromonas luteoviolacea S4054]KZN73224.1 hypothetical protein N481_12930 [Pseudoalteromonas luteoviolacea S4047-1]
MNDFLDIAALFFMGLGCLVVISFLYLFKERWLELVFVRNKNLKNKSDHELHSCFLTALTSIASFILFQHLLDYLYELHMDKMIRRQIYYFIAACGNASFIIALTLLHAIRECTFSSVARYACYMSLAAMMIKTLQLVLHGYLDISIFNFYYNISIFCLSSAQTLLVAKYPFNLLMQRKYAKEY